ncbi:GFA family protein [Mesorhizobium sp. CN2-181]|uniref:GFA family protein n=1 Tax=Mesorhizobium yinganensis TaxID=3157707 RepID=UPI0032B8499E
MCGEVRFSVSGQPNRVGLCHCKDCRASSGSAFAVFAIWPRPAFDAKGHVGTYQGRSFCVNCGSPLFSLGPDEAEIMLGSLDDAPTDLIPTYELWVCRREGWLPEMPWTDLFEKDRTGEAGDWRQASRTVAEDAKKG